MKRGVIEDIQAYSFALAKILNENDKAIRPAKLQYGIGILQRLKGKAMLIDLSFASLNIDMSMH